MTAPALAASVFINCPFDAAYQPLFDRLVFTVARAGFTPRCALEIDDGAGTRIDKILDLIENCPLAVHDISRTEPDAATGLPRFNMPFELGLFLGARRFGDARQRAKRCLVLDREPYRYRAFLSDIAGQDIHAHAGEPGKLVREVRNFLAANADGRIVPSAQIIRDDFLALERRKPEICAALELDPTDLTFGDYTTLVEQYLNLAT